MSQSIDVSREDRYLYLTGPSDTVLLELKEERVADSALPFRPVRDRVWLNLRMRCEPDEGRKWRRVLQCRTRDDHAVHPGIRLLEGGVSKAMVERIYTQLGVEGDARALVETIAGASPEHREDLAAMLNGWGGVTFVENWLGDEFDLT